MAIIGPTYNKQAACEQVLRSLPAWFGIESALVDYARATTRLPTFVATCGDALIGFLSLECLSASTCEIHCMAVHAGHRGAGWGTALLEAAITWANAQGASRLVVKTLADSHPSPAYRATRAFYQSRGFVADGILADLWGPSNPCLQMSRAVG